MAVPFRGIFTSSTGSPGRRCIELCLPQCLGRNSTSPRRCHHFPHVSPGIVTEPRERRRQVQGSVFELLRNTSKIPLELCDLPAIGCEAEEATAADRGQRLVAIGGDGESNVKNAGKNKAGNSLKGKGSYDLAGLQCLRLRQ